MKIVLVSKCSLDIEQYVEFKMSVLISPSKSLISSRWVTYVFHFITMTRQKKKENCCCPQVGFLNTWVGQSENYFLFNYFFFSKSIRKYKTWVHFLPFSQIR